MKSRLVQQLFPYAKQAAISFVNCMRTGKLIKLDMLNTMSFYFFAEVNYDSTGKLSWLTLENHLPSCQSCG